MAGFGELSGGPFRAGGGNLPLPLGGTVDGPLSGDDGIFLGGIVEGTLPTGGGGPLVALTGLGLGTGAVNSSLVGLLTDRGLTACGGVS